MNRGFIKPKKKLKTNKFLTIKYATNKYNQKNYLQNQTRMKLNK